MHASLNILLPHNILHHSLYFYSDHYTRDKVTVGKMKVALTLLCGSKPSEKAKCKSEFEMLAVLFISWCVYSVDLFSVLAKNGTLDQDGVHYFCETVQTVSNIAD